MMPSFGNVPRKSLADISNLQQWIKPMGQDERPQTASLFTKEYDQLQKVIFLFLFVSIVSFTFLFIVFVFDPLSA